MESSRKGSRNKSSSDTSSSRNHWGSSIKLTCFISAARTLYASPGQHQSNFKTAWLASRCAWAPLVCVCVCMSMYAVCVCPPVSVCVCVYMPNVVARVGNVKLNGPLRWSLLSPAFCGRTRRILNANAATHLPECHVCSRVCVVVCVVCLCWC